MFDGEKYQLSDAALRKFKTVIEEIFVTGNARTIRNLVSKVCLEERRMEGKRKKSYVLRLIF
jgi:hypothetical protein